MPVRVAWAASAQGLLGLAKAALYVPVRRGFGGSDLSPSLSGLMP